jgi:hypothetical protein
LAGSVITSILLSQVTQKQKATKEELLRYRLATIAFPEYLFGVFGESLNYIYCLKKNLDGRYSTEVAQGLGLIPSIEKKMYLPVLNALKVKNRHGTSCL